MSRRSQSIRAARRAKNARRWTYNEKRPQGRHLLGGVETSERGEYFESRPREGRHPTRD